MGLQYTSAPHRTTPHDQKIALFTKSDKVQLKAKVAGQGRF